MVGIIAGGFFRAPGMANCSDALDTCLADLNNVTTEYSNCTCVPDPCAAAAVVNFDLGLHIACVFVVLVCSILGPATPMLTKRLPYPWIPAAILMGKCMGTGVVLACGLIHMLQPSNQSLESPCLPTGFTDYAYAYLFCMTSSLMLHFLDFLLLRWMLRLNAQGVAVVAHIHGPDDDAHGHHHHSIPAPAVGDFPVDVPDPVGECADGDPPAPPGSPCPPGMEEVVKPQFTEAQVTKTVEAYMIEFAVTVHSVFIGIPVGVADQGTLQTLFVALCFHQFFEGVALGCRIVDANLTRLNEALLTSIFALAAPIGIAVGIAIGTSLNPNSSAFLLVQGTFDGFCSGLLIYIGYNLLIVDFPRDMAALCQGRWRHHLEAGMFIAVWTGAGIMAGLAFWL